MLQGRQSVPFQKKWRIYYLSAFPYYIRFPICVPIIPEKSYLVTLPMFNYFGMTLTTP